MIGGDDSVFLDTNVLVYAVVEESRFHDQALKRLQSYEQTGKMIWISRQILREFMAVLSRPQASFQPVPMERIVFQVREFRERFSIAEDNETVTEHLLQLLSTVPTGGKQIHDANIVATMLTYGVPALLTYNRSDFERYARFIALLDPAADSAV